MRTADTRLLLGRLAVMGPIAFTVAWIVGAVVQDEYSVRREDISGLAALDAQNAWIMITGFVLLGAGMVALGAGLAGALKGRPATVGSILVAVAGVGIIVAGLARNDCSSQLDACADRADAGDVSWHHVTHDLVSLVVFLALVAAALVFARAFRGDQSWRDLRRYCLITAVVGFVLLVGFITGIAGSWNGLLQRVFVTVLFVWIAVLGARLIRLSRTQSAQPTT